MKKSVLTILSILGVIGVFLFIFMPREKIKELNIPFFSNKNQKNDGNMQFISYDFPGNYENGYFYIKRMDEKENIMYFDYGLKKEIYLCNKPNCNHDSNKCSSYLNYFDANELFYYNDYLYYLDSSAGGTTISVSFDGTVDDSDQTPSTLYKINLDGTEKRKIFVAPSGTRMAMPFVIKGNILYAYLEKSKVVTTKGNTHTTNLTERNLVAINLETGKYEKINEGFYETLIGVYDDKLVIREILYDKDPKDFDDDTNAYANNLYNSKTRIKLLDVETKKEEVIYEDLYKNMENLQFYKDGIYIVGKNSKNLEYVSFSTKKKEIIKELPQSNMQINAIIDDKLLIYTYKDKDAHLGNAYYIDLISKEIKDFNLKDKNGYLIEILSSNKDYYFVKLESILGEEHMTWAGVNQSSIIGENYGLIKKTDYWSSKENYIRMTNAE